MRTFTRDEVVQLMWELVRDSRGDDYWVHKHSDEQVRYVKGQIGEQIDRYVQHKDRGIRP